MSKVHISWESHKNLPNLHLTFGWHYIGQNQGGDFSKFCGLLRIYELYYHLVRWFDYVIGCLSTSILCALGHVISKGPSINDVSPKGEGGGYKKCPKRRRLLEDLRRQGEGGCPKNLKFGETSFMDGP